MDNAEDKWELMMEAWSLIDGMIGGHWEITDDYDAKKIKLDYAYWALEAPYMAREMVESLRRGEIHEYHGQGLA